MRRKGPNASRPEEAFRLLMEARALSKREVLQATDSLSTVYRQCRAHAASLEKLADEFEVGGNDSLASRLHAQTRSARRLVEAILCIQEQQKGRAVRIEEAVRGIQRLCGSMGEIADASNILSLNIEIETARLGASGRAIGVIASEMKSQSDKTAEATYRITELADELTGLLSELGIESDEMAKLASDESREVLATAEELEDVLTRTSETLRQSMVRARDEAAVLQSETNRALKHLQFQDRMEQTLQRAQDELGIHKPSPRAHPKSHGASLMPVSEQQPETPPVAGEIDFF